MFTALSFSALSPALLASSAALRLPQSDGLHITLSPLNRDQNLQSLPLIGIPLATTDRQDQQFMMACAGLEHELTSPAANLALQCFQVGRRLGQHGPYENVTFDWDHTLSNYKIFDGLGGLLPVKLRAKDPGRHDQTIMSALEAPRPFMLELVFGTMVGFALRQGLEHFYQWNEYQPKVGLVTHTWADRLAVLAQHYLPLLSLMEGLAPGDEHIGDKIRTHNTRAFVHLGHFLAYADALLERYESLGMEGLTPAERYEVMQYMEDGKAHHRKPLTALAEYGWDTSTLLHFDDRIDIIADMRTAGIYQGAAAVYVPNPYGGRGKNVSEVNKVLPHDLFLEMLTPFARARSSKIISSAQALLNTELQSSPLSELLYLLDQDSFDFLQQLQELPATETSYTGQPHSGFPEGTHYTFYDTPTTLGEFWRNYVHPTRQRKQRIRTIRSAKGGLKEIRARYQALQASP